MQVVYRLETDNAATSPKNLYYERIQGYVHRFAHNSGWGFVRADAFEGDLFFHNDNLMAPFKDQKARLTSGQMVEFTIGPDDQHRPHAVFVKPVVRKTPYHLVGQRLSGFIRKFQHQGLDSVGFINSPFFDGDLICPQSNCLPAQVSFAFGQPCTFDIVAWEDGCVAQRMTTKVPCEPEDWVGQGRITGQLKSFQDRWGFINSDKFQGDLFVHRDGICDRFGPRRLTPGTIVEFEVGLDNISRGGRLLGINVTCEMPIASLESVMDYVSNDMPARAIPSPLCLSNGMSLCLPPSGMQPKARISTVQLSSLIDPPLSTVSVEGTSSQSVAPIDYTHQTYVTPEHTRSLSYALTPEHPRSLSYALTPEYTRGLTLDHTGRRAGARKLKIGVSSEPEDSSPDSVQSSAQRSFLVPTRPSFSESLFTTPVCGGSQHALFPAYAFDGCEAKDKLAEIRRKVDELCDETQDGETTSVTTAGEDDQWQPAAHTLSLATDSWEPDSGDHPQSPTSQPTTLKLMKGDLLKLLHDSTTGWAYAARWTPQEGELDARGWVPIALLKEVRVCRAQNDWDDSAQDKDGTRSTMSLRWGEWVATDAQPNGADWVYGSKVGSKVDGRRDQCGWIPRTLVKLA